MNNESDTTSTLKEAIHGEDEPIGKQVPGAPFAIVALSYAAVLIVGALVVALAIWMF